MKKNILFTCPACGGSQLLLLENSLNRFDVLQLCVDDNEKIHLAESLLRDSLQGEILGYRCKACRYPDSNKPEGASTFSWPSLDAIVKAGAISWQGYQSKVEHKCMLCLPNGTLKPLVVAVDHPGKLSPEERQLIIEREQHQHAVLLCQTDPGIKSFDCKNWNSVKKHQISYP